MSGAAMHRVTVSLLMGLLVVAGVLLDAGAAQACSCMEPASVRAQIEGSPLAFTATQVDRIEGNTGVTLVMEVDQAFKGEVGDIVELSTGFGDADCGIDLGGAGMVGIIPYVGEGELSISICGGVVDATAMRYNFEPLPEPTGAGPPAFAVGMSLADARLALLDGNGRILGYGKGEGRVVGFAACPGGRFGVEMVEMAEAVGGPDVRWLVGGAYEPTLAVRHLETLEVVSQERIELTERATTWGNAHGWLADLQCHDEDGSSVTYLATSGEWNDITGSDEFGSAELHVWGGGEQTVHDVGVVRTGQASPQHGRAWLVGGPDGHDLITFDLATGGVADEATLPGEQVGWLTSWDPAAGTFAVLGRHAPLDPAGGIWPEVDVVTVYDVATGEAVTHSLPDAGSAMSLVQVGGEVVASVGVEDYDVDPPYLGVVTYVVAGATVEEAGRLEGSDGIAAAVARPAALVSLGWTTPAAVTISGETTPIDGVYDVTLLSVVGNDEVEPVDLPDTTATPAGPDVGGTPTTLPGSAEATLPPGSDGSFPGYLGPLLLGIGAVGAGVLLLRRRKPSI